MRRFMKTKPFYTTPFSKTMSSDSIDILKGEV